MPVLPLVASITVMPGLSAPLRSASSMTARAMRSFTDPIGLNASTLTYTLTPAGASLLSFTTGVLPMVSRMFLKRAMKSSYSRHGEGASWEWAWKWRKNRNRPKFPRPLQRWPCRLPESPVRRPLHLNEEQRDEDDHHRR